MTSFRRRAMLTGGAVAAAAPLFAATEILPPGFRPLPASVHALTGGTVIVKPGQTLSNATIIIRDGYIESVSTNSAAPADARVWDLKGFTIYAGFIDPYLSTAPKSDNKTTADERQLTSGGVKFYGSKTQETAFSKLTGPGYEVAMVRPEQRMAQNYTPDAKALEKLRELGFTCGNFVPEKGIFRGTSAFATLGDETSERAILKPDVFQHIVFDLENRKEDVYPESLMGVVAVLRQSFLDAQHYADEQSWHEKNLRKPPPPYNQGKAALANALGQKMPFVFEPQDALLVDRSARIAQEFNVNFYILSSGEEWRRPDLAKTAGVPFIVPLDFPELPKMPQTDDWSQVSLDQFRAWDWAPENAAVLQNQGITVALTTFGLDDKKDFRKNLRLALDRGFSESNALAALTTVPATLCGLDSLLGTIEAGKQANLTIVAGTNYFDPEAKINSVWIRGRNYPVIAADEKDSDGEKVNPAPTNTLATTATNAPAKKEPDSETKEKKLKILQARVARAPLAGRGVLANPSAVLIRHATLWTCGPQGILTNADLLIERGNIKAVGTHLEVSNGSVSPPLIIDGTGLHVTPGLIDCHSHSMILGDVNESTLPSTAMVRIGDVVNSESENIYQQLAGGLTVVNLLHGSANPIGGQNCVIKLRDGETPEGLKFLEAPQGIKFALGENVKQSNWGDKVVDRFPQTRMGVRTFFANRFTAAQQYLKAWADFSKNGGLAPRRDLELEAIGEILAGQRLIHCHSYRQDEILMLMRLMESFGVRIGTLQHVLEGYKIADEIAKHGAGGSTFSDWWAYKFEVYDAIPYNGSLMRERGVNVSFNSDSSDLARRLYLEAAKAVKYGNTPEVEALKFVTLNPAIQLHIDKFVGSLEPGKQGDFVIWSRSPLAFDTVCQQTWIEGRKYFDITLTPARTKQLAEEWDQLAAKAKKLADKADEDEDAKPGSEHHSFFHQSLEHLYDGRVRHCLDNENE